MLALLCFGVLLRQNVCEFFGIWPDMWMQDRYYRNHGIVTGFVTNLRVLNITAPDGYGEAAVQQLAQETRRRRKRASLCFQTRMLRRCRKVNRWHSPISSI